MGGTVLIVGVGNELLGDEGLGVHVARSLLAMQAELPAGVVVFEAGTALFDLAPEMGRYPHMILVDAIRKGGEPGAIYRVELDGDLEGGFESLPPLSLHDDSLFDTLARVKLLGLLPQHLTLIGAEPERIAPSLELSPALQRAAERIVSTLLAEARPKRE